VFKPILAGTGLPLHGPKPGAIEDGGSLWWHHERLRRRLEDFNSAVRDSFFQERDALEARFLERVDGLSALNRSLDEVEARQVMETCWRESMEFESRWLS
jgi:hypothetical protein